MRWMRVLAVAGLMIMLAGLGQGGQALAFNACEQSKDPEVRVKACTREIVLGKWSGNKLADIYYSRGDAWLDQHQYGNAIADFSKAIELNPRLAAAYYNRGIAWSDQHQYDKAIVDYNRAIELSPGHAKAYFNRCLVWETQGEYDEALDDYTKALGLMPTDAKTYGRRALVFLQLGRYQEALADAQKGVKLDPRGRSDNKKILKQVEKEITEINRLPESYRICMNSENMEIQLLACTEAINSGRCPPKRLAMAYHNRSSLWYWREEYDKAIADCDSVLKIFPRNVDTYNNRGIAWANKRQYNKAMADYNKAIKLDPKHSWAYLSRGNAWLHMGQYEKAAADYGKAIELNPIYANAYANRAYALFKLGRYQEALALAQKGVELDRYNETQNRKVLKMIKEKTAGK